MIKTKVYFVIYLIIFNGNFAKLDARQGIKVIGNFAISENTSQIMARDCRIQKTYKVIKKSKSRKNLNKTQNKLSPQISRFPNYSNKNKRNENIFRILKALKIQNQPQKIALNFLAGSLARTQLFPPDSMGAVGPSQFIVAINGLIKTFNKKTGLADGALNIDTDLFFKSICQCNSNIGTSDPRIRYDVLTKRWFIIMINTANTRDRLLIAVSNSAIITKSTKWNFFFINTNTNQFFDQPTLGIDANALYIGGVPFNNNGELNSTVYIIQKKSILFNGPIVYNKFENLAHAKDYQGVDNASPNSNVGYLISVDSSIFGRLVLRRVFNPGTDHPTLSNTIFLTIPATAFPIPVDHKGNNFDNTSNKNLGKLDVNDDRLIMAQIKNNSLWTTHHIGVNNKGISPNNINGITRTASRWYQIGISKNIPVLKQVGTLFDKTPTNSTDAASFFYPSIMVSQQGNLALGCSKAGKNEYINAVTAGRLVTDPLGTLRTPTYITHSQTSYNPPGDSTPSDVVRRWGDYSYTSLDQSDQMTMWTIQEYCNSKNSWACRVAKLLAPPPSMPTLVSPKVINISKISIDIKIVGKSINGSGFFDSKNGTSKLKVIISDVITNKVTFINPQEIIVNVSTANCKQGLKDVTIINPDGQRVTCNNLIKVENCSAI